MYLKNLYFKSLRRFVLWVYPTYQYLTKIFTLKPSSLIKIKSFRKITDFRV
ncbi:hypothetical protein HPHPP13_0581 [Helicobacter pylori Hp P-13]|nr:hypothetical protein HPHPP13_0581 [Helicobacter pylori Hp P-13]